MDRAAKRIRKALEGEEFALFCQAIEPLQRAHEPAMAEVLVRLREEEAALLPPGDFFPVLEQSGMMPLLDAWVVKRVLERQGLRGEPRYCVNVSAQSLADPGFAAWFSRLAGAAGLAKGRVLFEIDEADLIAAPERAREFACAARGAGAGIAIDGFGRRPGSFGAVSTLKPDFIKIDGCVTRRVCDDAESASRVKTFLQTAGVLGIRVVAECVEEPRVLAKLRALGVDFAQGFGVAAPGPLPEAKDAVPASAMGRNSYASREAVVAR